MVSRILFEKTGGNEKFGTAETYAVIREAVFEITELITAVKSISGNPVIVTNEVGFSIVPMNKAAREFSDIQGSVNRQLARITDKAVLIVCGLPITLK